MPKRKVVDNDMDEHRVIKPKSKKKGKVKIRKGRNKPKKGM